MKMGFFALVQVEPRHSKTPIKPRCHGTSIWNQVEPHVQFFTTGSTLGSRCQSGTSWNLKDVTNCPPPPALTRYARGRRPRAFQRPTLQPLPMSKNSPSIDTSSTICRWGRFSLKFLRTDRAMPCQGEGAAALPQGRAVPASRFCLTMHDIYFRALATHYAK